MQEGWRVLPDDREYRSAPFELPIPELPSSVYWQKKVCLITFTLAFGICPHRTFYIFSSFPLIPFFWRERIFIELTLSHFSDRETLARSTDLRRGMLSHKARIPFCPSRAGNLLSPRLQSPWKQTHHPRIYLVIVPLSACCPSPYFSQPPTLPIFAHKATRQCPYNPSRILTPSRNIHVSVLPTQTLSTASTWPSSAGTYKPDNRHYNKDVQVLNYHHLVALLLQTQTKW